MSPDVRAYHRKLSTEQKYKNYDDLLKTISFLENGGELTHEWVREHREVILKYRSWFPSFLGMHKEVKYEEFRRKCWETEVVMQQLCDTIDEALNIDLYLNLVTNMKYICDIVDNIAKAAKAANQAKVAEVAEVAKECEITNLLKKMSI